MILYFKHLKCCKTDFVFKLFRYDTGLMRLVKLVPAVIFQQTQIKSVKYIHVF